MNAPAVQTLCRRLENGELLSLAGAPPAAQAFLLAALQRRFPHRSIVLVADHRRTQELFEQDVRTWLQWLEQPPPRRSQIEEASPRDTKTGSRPASASTVQRPGTLFYPDWEVLPHESTLPHADVISERLETLSALLENPSNGRPIITNVTALLQRTFRPEGLQNRTRHVRHGDRIDPLDLVEWLEAQGYEPEAQVNTKGQLSLRGGILDVFPLTSPWPVRLEFFGNELESLRFFDPVTQISREAIDTVTLPPAGELGILRQFLAPASPEAAGTLIDYLPAGSFWLLSEPDQLSERAAEYSSRLSETDPLFVRWDQFTETLQHRNQRPVELTADAPLETGLAPDTESQPPSPTCPGFQSLEVFRPQVPGAARPELLEVQRREFFQQLHRWMRQGLAVHVVCNNEGERQRFLEVWKEHGLDDSPEACEARSPQEDSMRTCPLLHLGALSRGFIWEAAGLVVVTDAEVFGRDKIQRPRRLKAAHAQATRSALEIDFTDLEEGDLVVHLQHGIGRYLGLQSMPSGTSRHRSDAGPGPECLVLEFAPSDPDQPFPKLYVPVSEAHLVSKYVGAGKARPPLNTLGGTRWKKAKEQAERAVRDVAAEMLSIQAARESQPGYAFGPDTHWQREFEAAFIYEETPDQFQAITETKTDLERARPMDRLICGDVGFGKTEVAIRAAFKAVMGGKQVAVLVPTTVLAQQHFNTFSERMADYPVRVELLSRFRSRRQQQQVVRDLALGSVDIVVGTHRLVQSDVVFKDLGLVVVDEEQRFGVLHKERLKQLRTLVDVLTLSATPIPRTLYLAMCGARDMSTIQTPPQDRLPVETIVSPYDERLIRTAIERELHRGGQVFFLHNRVLTIDTMARKLQDLVPHARIVVGHGQMHADDLEEVMTRFVNGEADVLLSTTIIESGLDIPNANTIIIDRADRFGLSDLYQLRGRVGRYKHQAYAYLLIPRHAGLLTEARKRISAIRQYATLGSGFKIAMRDLEIRGAGNLLGAEQSGHITAVGFDLYCQLLKQSVSALKGEPVQPRVTVEVNLDFLQVGLDFSAARPEPGSRTTHPAAASLPYAYVADSRQRIGIYRKLAECADRAAVQALEVELTDRFGPPPESVKHLLALTDLKVLAAERHVTRIESEEDKLKLTRHDDFIQVGGKFPRLTGKTASARLKEIRRVLTAL
ncbi:MAG: transcription-repair coupling factor [Verrucomicrobia bacterium]|jgi:transcription-repair coupling factor (superfamily II helicase)|nr:transcription-repair coupling factor [Verrucomicrobiota bacterium]